MVNGIKLRQRNIDISFKPIYMLEATKYIDPLMDFAFKKIFGTDPNKDLLIDFLNEVFRGRKHIVDLICNKNEHPGDLKNEGGVIFDLLCTGDNNDHFIIEIQRSKQPNFKQRSLFYTSRLISDQAQKGKRSEWRYDLTEVFLIALMENSVVSDFPKGQFLHDICLCDRHTGEIFYDRLGYIYIELYKFVKTPDQLETGLDKWLFVLKNMSSMDKIPAYLRKPIFEKLFNIAQFTNLTKEEKTMWDIDAKRRWDNKNASDYAIEEAEKAIDEAKEKGMKEGKKEGREEVIRVTILKMKEKGFSIQQIAEFMDLQLSEIEGL